MPDLTLSPEQQQLQDATRRLLAARLDAVVARLPEPPVHDSREALQDARDLGWLGLGLPEDVGGAGDFRDLALVHEELGRGLAPSLVTSLTVAARLLLHGNVTHPLLAHLAAGDEVVVPALGDVTLTGSRLSGSVRHVADARAASQLLVAARDSGSVQLLLVPVSGALLTDEPSASDTTACRVDLEDAAGEVVSTDARAALDRVQVEAIVLAAARAVGGGRAVLARTVEHVRTRHQFDRPIGTFQAVQHQLADVATALDAAGLAVARAAWAVDQSPADLEAAAAVAGLAAGEAFAHATLTAHQLHGGMGFVLDSPLHLWSARAVGDPTVPATRRALLDQLATATGLPAGGDAVLPPEHRRVTAST